MKYKLYLFTLLTGYYSMAQPTVDITTSVQMPTNTTPIQVTFTFSEDVVDFTADDISVSKGFADNLTANNGSEYTVEITPEIFDMFDTIRVSLGADVVTGDPGGLGNEASGTLEIIYDGEPPQVLSVIVPDTIFNTDPYEVKLIFSEPVELFDPNAFLIQNGDFENLNFPGDFEDTVTFDIRPFVDNGVISFQPVFPSLQDSLSNQISRTLSISSTIIDIQAPLFDLSILARKRSNTSPMTGRLVFSELMDVPDLADLTATNATLGNLRQVTYSKIENVAEAGADLGIDQDGNLWIPDINVHQVYKYSKSGELLLTLGIGTPGTANDQFNGPLAVSFDRNGHVYIGDFLNNRVQVFDLQGNFVRSIAGSFASVLDVAVAEGEDLLFVADFNSVHAFDLQGNPLYKIERNLADPDDMDVTDPVSITVDTVSNSLYVLNRDQEDLLYWYDLDGNLIERSGADGLGFLPTTSLLDRITFDYTTNRLYCAFRGSSLITVFQGINLWEGLFGLQDRAGTDEGLFNTPTGIDFGPDNRMYVMDFDNKDINIIDLETGFDDQGVNTRPDFGIAYEFDIIPESGGAITVEATSGIFSDLLGNASVDQKSATVQYDINVPAISLQQSMLNATEDTLNITLGFSEPAVFGGIASLEVDNGKVVEKDFNNFDFGELSVYQTLGVAGQSGPGNFQFKTPVDINTDSKGNVYVTDVDKAGVSVFDRAGNFTTTLVTEPDLSGFGPAFLSIDDNDNVYVTDVNNGGVAVFGPDLSYSRSFAPEAIEPLGIDIDGDGNLYVSDQGDHFVRVYDTEGNFIRNVGYSDTDPARDTVSFFNVKVSPFNQVFLIAESKPLIYVFDSNSEFARLIDIKAILGPDDFPPDIEPLLFDLEFGDNGDQYIVIPGSADVVVLNNSGEVTGRLSDVIVSPDISPFVALGGIHIDNNGVMYVADLESNRVVSYANPIESVSFQVVPATKDAVNLTIQQGEVVDGFGNVNAAFSALLRESVVTSLEQDIAKGERVRLYPNPAHDHLFVEIPMENGRNQNGTYIISITDASGRVRAGYEMTGQTAQLDVSYLPAGMHLIKIEGNDSLKTFRFLKAD